MGHNMKNYYNLSLDECQAKCTGNKNCLGIEYFRNSGRTPTSSAYKEGDCILNDSTDTLNPPCDADYYQMYFWKLGQKMDCDLVRSNNDKYTKRTTNYESYYNTDTINGQNSADILEEILSETADDLGEELGDDFGKAGKNLLN